MLKNFLRYLRGYVVFEIVGNFPERFINLCMQRGVGLFGISPESDGFFASMFLTDYKGIRHLAHRSRVRLAVKKRVGLPFVMQRYKARRGLLFGAVLFVIISLLMQSFVWTVEIRGAQTLSISALNSVLYEEGFKPGALKNHIDPIKVERRLSQEFSEIGWVSVNMIGTKAEIEIKEKAKKPYIIDYRTPYNVVAGCDGLVESIITKQGSAVTKKGSAVIEGQLLVSGVMVNALDEVRYVHADAEVIASTTHKFEKTIPESVRYISCQDPIYRKNIILPFIKFPITFQSVSGEYTTERIHRMVFIDNTQVPVGIREDKIIPLKNNTQIITPQKAEDILRTEDYLNRLFALHNATDISPKSTIEKTDEGYSLTVTYTCREDIAQEEVFVVN